MMPALTSRPESGSSSSRRSGLWSRAALSSTFCRIPFEYVSSEATRSSARPSCVRKRSMRALQPIFGDFLEATDELQELLAREALEEPRRLRHVAQALLRLGGLLGHRAAGHPHRPAARRQDAGQDLDGRALPGAVRAQQPDHLAGPHRERDAVQHLAAAVAERQAVDLHDRVAGNDGVRHRSVRRDLCDMSSGLCCMLHVVWGRGYPNRRRGFRRRLPARPATIPAPPPGSASCGAGFGRFAVRGSRGPVYDRVDLGTESK